MNWFWKWVDSKCCDARYKNVTACEPIRAREEPLEGCSSFKFEVISAQGGVILKRIGDYDKRTDRVDIRLYLIPENEDYITEISRLISMELLK